MPEPPLWIELTSALLALVALARALGAITVDRGQRGLLLLGCVAVAVAWQHNRPAAYIALPILILDVVRGFYRRRNKSG